VPSDGGQTPAGPPPADPWRPVDPSGPAGPPYAAPPPVGPPGHSPYPSPPGSGYGPPYGQVPYGTTPYGYPLPHQRPGTNGFAVASLVCGVLWLFWVGSVLAVVFGILALGQIRARGEGGRGLAIAGVVLGGLGMSTLVLAVIGLAVSSTSATYSLGVSS
jgi:hypothetical protein